MSDMNKKTERKRLAELVAQIRSLRPKISSSVDTATRWLDRLSSEPFANEGDRVRAQYCATAYRESLMKVDILLENNLHFVETLGVLALTRYIFELLVWFRVLAQNPEQAFEFYWQIIEKQIAHIEGNRVKLRNEIAYFKELDKRDGIPNDVLISLDQDPVTVSARDMVNRMHANANMIDQEARRSFSLYAEDAKTNGYAYQAFLMESKGLPILDKELDKLLAEMPKFQAQVGHLRLDAVIKPNGKRQRWNWQERAKSVGMSKQYEYIYGYTSRLLHATPSAFPRIKKILKS
jgi:hypothetical protein